MHESKIILFYNRMWGQPLDYPAGDIPEPYTLTTDRRALGEAVAVVFHLPSLPADVIPGGQLTKKKDQLWVLCLRNANLIAFESKTRYS